MFTILGAGGFIGSRLLAELRRAGADVLAPERHDEAWLGRELGHVIDCVGVTSDFRTRPLDAIDAHVARLPALLRRGRFESLLYLSSARVYRGLAGPAREDDALLVRPDEGDDLYNLSKLTGEAACLGSGRANVRVARLSNVYGPGMARDNFLAAVIAEALDAKRVLLSTTLDSCKDYVAIEDVARLLPRIAREGRHRIYNIAAGRNVANGELAGMLARLTGCLVAVAPDARRSVFPALSIERAARELGFVPLTLEDKLPDLVKALRERMVAA